MVVENMSTTNGCMHRKLTQLITTTTTTTTTTIIIIIIIIMKTINSSEGGPYCELGLPGGAEMHTLSMDDFQVIFLITIIIVLSFNNIVSNLETTVANIKLLLHPQTLPSELQAQEVIFF